MSYQAKRDRMVAEQLQAQDIRNFTVLQVMRQVPRHRFLPIALRERAYANEYLTDDHQLYLQSPYENARILEASNLHPQDRVLEIGTGTGYVTALLAEMTAYVYSVEANMTVASQTGDVLSQMNYDNLEVYVGDGSQGLADMAPYQRIVCNRALPILPRLLCNQLDPNGGTLILAIGTRYRQTLKQIIRQGDQWGANTLMNVKFPPLLGRYGFEAEENDDARR